MAGNTHSESKPVDQRQQYLWKVHGYINEYIRFADTKAGFIVVLDTAIIGALYAIHCQQRFLNTAPIQWSFTALAALFAFIALGLSVVASILVVRPRLNAHSIKGYIFWESIVEHGTQEAFESVVLSQTDENLTSHLAQHIFILSKIAHRKYFWINLAICWGTLGGLAAAIDLLK